jgi:alpha-glucosidase (family GH31 glycosyl hydrolase)
MTGILTRATTNDLFNKDDFLELSVSIVQEAQLRTHITIQPTNSERWTVPESLLPRPGGLYDPNDPSYAGAPHSKAEVTSDPFNIQVTRSSSGSNPYGRNDVIFNLTNDIIFQDQYIQFVLKTPSTIVATYGFGESTRDTQQLQEGSIYTLWNSDTPAASFDQSLYGSHPFFIQVTDKGKAQGVFFMNSNAMELTVSGSDTEGQTLGIQTTGGIIDIYVFAGPTPVEVVRQYLDVIGKPAFVPFWSLGFHNCRWGM